MKLWTLLAVAGLSVAPCVAQSPPGLNFAPAVAYAAGFFPVAVAIADVNGDGKPDLIVVDTCAGNSNTPCVNSAVGVLLGNGDGTFQAIAAYSSGGYGSVSVAVADVNGDGKPDLIVANECATADVNCANATGGNVGVILGNGDGTFQPVVTYGSGASYASSVVVADVNGDGKPDLVVGNNCAALQPAGITGVPTCTNTAALIGVLLGNGDGTFQRAVTYPSGGHGVANVAVADVNLDDKPDLLVGSCYSSCDFFGIFGVLLGKGDGTFQPAVTYNWNAGDGASIAVGDVNLDGKPDVVLSAGCNSQADPNGGFEICVSGGQVGVFLGNGDGTFQPPVTYPTVGIFGAGPVAVKDMNGDGKPDIVVINECMNIDTCSPIPTVLSPVTVLIGNGDGTFESPLSYGSGGYDGSGLAVADLNGDGKPDIVTDNACAAGNFCLSGSVGVLLNAHPSVVALVSSPNPSDPGQTVTFTASVTSPGNGTAAGTVTFYDGTTGLGTSPLNGSGVATLAVSSLASGTHSITADYSGGALIAPGVSAPLSETVLAPFVTITGSPQPPLTKDGQGNFVAQLTITNTGNVTITTVQVTVAGTKLGSGSTISAPAPISNLVPGASAVVTLKFPSSSVSSTATTAPLKVSGTYSAPSFSLSGNWGLSFRSVTL